MFLKLLTGLLFLIVNSSVTALVIESSIDNGTWKTNTAISPLKGQQIALRVKNVSGASIRWYQIFPDLSTFHKNAGHFGDDKPYQWIGLDTIKYERKELSHFRDQWNIQPFTSDEQVVSSFQQNAVVSMLYHTDVGSFWFQVEVERNGNIQQSAGLEKTTKMGLSRKVFRVSIRDGDDYLGYLKSFYNVPAIFGSVIYQSKHYIGVDCADVLVTAYSKWKGHSLKRNYNVANLVNRLAKRGEFDLSKGVFNKKIIWGTHIIPGDLIAVRYAGSKQYQHIGALSEDANQNGILDGEDIVLHAGFLPLDSTRLKYREFDGHVVILRPSGHF